MPEVWEVRRLMTQLSFSIPTYMIVLYMAIVTAGALTKIVLYFQERKLGKLRRENDTLLIKNLSDENIRLEGQVSRQREIIADLRGE